LNNHFSSVFSIDDQKSPVLNCPPFNEMPGIVIELSGVVKLMENIKPFKASGPDNITGRFLKETSNELAKGMTFLFQASVHHGDTPDPWRHALVTPLYKPGKTDRSNPENYRPISLTSISCKLLEHIIYSNIIKHLDSKMILSNNQHGFHSKRSCETQLVKTIHDLSTTLNNGELLDSIVWDFSKVFDKVNHWKLCYKLNNMA